MIDWGEWKEGERVTLLFSNKNDNWPAAGSEGEVVSSSIGRVTVRFDQLEGLWDCPEFLLHRQNLTD